MFQADQSYFSHIAQYFPQELFRFFFFTGTAYLLFYAILRNKLLNKKIQARFPSFKEIRFEIFHSITSLFIFVSMAKIVFTFFPHKLYYHISEHGILYFILSVITLILVHDTYFYWAHRFMHWKKIYKYVHRIHHVSTNPTPFTAYSFHPIEAVLENAVLFMVLIIPIHPFAFIAFGLFQITWNITGHLGFEVFPSGFTTHPITKWFNSSTHHNMHHKRVKCNYGLYFNFWDTIMGTNHPEYHEEFERVATSKASKTENSLETI